LTLFRFVVLSMLLHTLIVVLFGTSTGGGARRGAGFWDPLEVTLRRLSPEPGTDFKLAPGADTSVPGSALLRRSESRASPPPITPQPQVADRPTESPVTTKAVPSERGPGAAEPAPAIRESAPPIQEPTPQPAPPAFETLPHLNLKAPELIEREIAPPAELKPREVPIAPAAPVERIAPPKIERETTPAIEPRPREIPTPAQTPVEQIAPPRVERELAPPVPAPAPRAVPADTTAPPERIAPTIQRESVPAPESLPRSAPVDATPRTERSVAPSVAPDSTPAARAPARPEAISGEAAPRPRLGPSVEDEIFKPRGDAVPPSSAVGAPPRLDLDATKKRAREIAGDDDYRGAVPAVPPPPDRNSKLAEAIAKAAKPDCRTAYADMGLLAIAPLVVSTVGNGGCRW
jgi:hypothetical protein